MERRHRSIEGSDGRIARPVSIGESSGGRIGRPGSIGDGSGGRNGGFGRRSGGPMGGGRVAEVDGCVKIDE